MCNVYVLKFYIRIYKNFLLHHIFLLYSPQNVLLFCQLKNWFYFLFNYINTSSLFQYKADIFSLKTIIKSLQKNKKSQPQNRGRSLYKTITIFLCLMLYFWYTDFLSENTCIRFVSAYQATPRQMLGSIVSDLNNKN